MPENIQKNNLPNGESLVAVPENTLGKLCACGCGLRLTVARSAKYNYLPWHATKERHFCACGCGNKIASAKPGARFLIGHHKRKPMKMIICQHCGAGKPVKQHSKARFCSRKCSAVHLFPALRAAAAAIKGKPRHIKFCKVCGTKIERYPKDVLASGNIYCSTECYWEDRKQSELSDISVTPYIQRKKVMATRPNRCERCLYDRIPEVLQIHHDNENTRDGRPENIELLCPTCHEEEHFFRKTGRFTPRKHATRGQPRDFEDSLLRIATLENG